MLSANFAPKIESTFSNDQRLPNFPRLVGPLADFPHLVDVSQLAYVISHFIIDFSFLLCFPKHMQFSNILLFIMFPFLKRYALRVAGLPKFPATFLRSRASQGELRLKASRVRREVTGRPLFPGASEQEQLTKIIKAERALGLQYDPKLRIISTLEA